MHSNLSFAISSESIIKDSSIEVDSSGIDFRGLCLV